MVPGIYRDLFAAVAASASALTGLRFVAISVAPRQSRGSGPPGSAAYRGDRQP